MLESVVEKKLTLEVKKHGGWSIKFQSPGLNGVPDRLVLFSGGRVAFIELKAPGKKLRPLQEKRLKQLKKLGFLVYVIDNLEMIGGVLNEIQST